jgi:hypothetical protein
LPKKLQQKPGAYASCVKGLGMAKGAGKATKNDGQVHRQTAFAILKRTLKCLESEKLSMT